MADQKIAWELPLEEWKAFCRDLGNKARQSPLHLLSSDTGEHIIQGRRLDVVMYDRLLPYELLSDCDTLVKRDRVAWSAPVDQEKPEGKIPWETGLIAMNGAYPVPRRVFYCSLLQATTCKSGNRVHVVHPIASLHPDTGRLLYGLMEFLFCFTGQVYNFCVVDLYRNGQDHTYARSEDDENRQADSIIASVSVGAAYPLSFQLKKGSEVSPQPGVTRLRSKMFNLGGGNVILMKGDTQKHFTHSKNASKTDKGWCINFTFRLNREPPMDQPRRVGPKRKTQAEMYPPRDKNQTVYTDCDQEVVSIPPQRVVPPAPSAPSRDSPVVVDAEDVDEAYTITADSDTTTDGEETELDTEPTEDDEDGSFRNALMMEAAKDKAK